MAMRREVRVRKAWGGFLAMGVLAGVAGGLLVTAGEHGVAKWAVLALMAAVLAAVFAAAGPWWARLDDMQRDGRLVSWYWGGAFGGGLGLLAALALGGTRSPLVYGALLVWVPQCAGYLLYRLGWTLSHRVVA
jgi:hypothetical protein